MSRKTKPSLLERWRSMARQRRGPFGFDFWLDRGYCPCLSHVKVGALIHTGPRKNKADKTRLNRMYWLPAVGPWQLYVRKPRIRVGFSGRWDFIRIGGGDD